MNINKKIFLGSAQVYIVEFTDGWVKVGRGINASDRIKCHAGTSKLRDAKVIRKYESKRIYNAHDVELELINICAATSKSSVGREWHNGVSFESLVKCIEALADDSDLARDKIIEEKEIALKKIDKVFSGSLSLATKTPEEIAWQQAVVHARTIQRVMEDDLFWSSTFEPKEYGMSKFTLSCAIVVYCMCPGEIAEIYCLALSSPLECINTVNGKSAEDFSRSSAGVFE